MEGDGVNEFKPIIEAISLQYLLEWDGLHGVGHWGRVLENGLLLAESTGADLEVVRLFSIFHDACRKNDGIDPGHGKRGAELAKSFRGLHFELPQDQFDLLYAACVGHTDGKRHGDITVLTCWDADRLDLSRAHITPKASRMCTEPAQDPDIIAWAIDRSLTAYRPPFVEQEWLSYNLAK
jgi:uncharacterized protein